MKNIKLIITALCITTFFVFGQCSKKTEEPQLPPETQTGANTFGCLIDGKVFLPGGAQLSGGALKCNYQFLGSGTNGGYHFRLVGIKNNNSTGVQESIGLFTDSLKLLEGLSYDLLLKGIKNSASAHYLFSESSPVIRFNDFFTNSISKGSIAIKKLDTINQIVSGTFWFDAINSNNQKVEIRDGRFDMRYTR